MCLNRLSALSWVIKTIQIRFTQDYKSMCIWAPSWAKQAISVNSVHIIVVQPFPEKKRDKSDVPEDLICQTIYDLVPEPSEHSLWSVWLIMPFNSFARQLHFSQDYNSNCIWAPSWAKQTFSVICISLYFMSFVRHRNTRKLYFRRIIVQTVFELLHKLSKDYLWSVCIVLPFSSFVGHKNVTKPYFRRIL